MKRQGFSTVEIAVVLTLVGVALAIMAPSLVNGLRTTTTKAALNEFVSTHALARSVAVRYGRLAELHIDPTANRYWIEVDTTTTTTSAKATIGMVRDLNVKGVDLASDRSLLCFDARGFPSTRDSCESAAAMLIFTASGKADTLTLSSFGKVER